MIKVLQYIPSYNFGGIESFVLNMNAELKEKCEFTYVVELDVDEQQKEKISKIGGKIIRIPNLTKDGIVKHIISLNRIIKNNKYDVIHVHGCDIRVFAMFFAKLYKINTRILHVHTTKIERHEKIKRIFLYLNICFANKLLACSREAAKNMFGKKEREAVVVKNGIDIKEYEYNFDYRKKLRKNLNIPEDYVVLGNVGRFVEVKNQAFLIKVYNEYYKYNSKSKLILIGDGPLIKDLKKQVEEFELKEKVIFLTNRNDINEIYSALDCFVLPSKYEGLGIVLIEAQANGLKCIVSTGVPKDADITDTLNFIDLSESPNYWARMILKQDLDRYEKNEKIIEAGFDRKSVALELFNIYIGENSEDNK